MATTSASITRPKTAREEAAALERSKREAEMAEMRRLRQAAEQAEVDDIAPSASSSAEAARKKREEEMAELRRLKANSNNEMRKKLQEKGGSLITDMDAWRAEQLGAKDKDRKNKLDAQSGLHTYQGSYTRNKTNAELGALEDRKNKAEAESNLHGHKGIVNRAKTNAELDKAALTQAQKDQMARMGQLSLDGGGDQGVNGVPSNDASAVVGDDNAPKESVKQAAEKLAKMEKEQAENRRLSSGTTTKKDVATSPPPPEAAPEPPKETPKVQYDISDTNAPAEEAPRLTLKPPTYSRVDIKFSFGLIVRSSAADGFNGENLRDNETLKKCMEGTSKILKEQMPSPPDVAKLLMEKNTTETSLKVKFPQSYYEPTFEPTVISIEEDKKNEDSSKVTAKGNKRTLVKASFPVFMRDEDGVSEDDKKRSARMLKETKTTVFKALRSAVSGGSFLR